MEACKLVMKTRSVRGWGDKVIFRLSGTANSYRTSSYRDRDPHDLPPYQENKLRKLDGSRDHRGNQGSDRTPSQKAGDERRTSTWERKWMVDEAKSSPLSEAD